VALAILESKDAERPSMPDLVFENSHDNDTRPMEHLMRQLAVPVATT
jgi:hypothetical protein